MEGAQQWYVDQAAEAIKKEEAIKKGKSEIAQAQKESQLQEDEQAKEHTRKVVCDAVEGGLRHAGHPEDREVILNRISGPHPAASGKDQFYYSIEFPEADAVYFGPFDYKKDNPTLSRYIPVRSTDLFVHDGKKFGNFSDALVSAAKARTEKRDAAMAKFKS